MKTSSLGDIIQSFDLLVYIKKKNPYAVVDWVVESSCYELVSTHPLIDHVYQIVGKNLRKGLFSFFKELISFRKKVKKYDCVIDLQGNIKSSLYLMMVPAKKKMGFCRRSVPEWPNLFFTNWKVSCPKGQNIRQDYLFFGQTIFQDFFSPLPQKFSCPLTFKEELFLKSLSLPDAYYVLAPFSRWPNKELEFSLLQKILDKHLPLQAEILLLCKGEQEKKKAEELACFLKLPVQILEGCSFSLLSYLLQNAKQAFCMDSMILHLAAYVGCPTLSFFSASSKNKYAPLGAKHIAYQGHCPYKKTFEKRCPLLRKCSGPCRSALKEI